MGRLVSSYGAAKPVHIGLVAGPSTIENLGPVIRHLVVGLLDEPMRMSLICPRHAQLQELHLPCPPVGVHEYDMPKLPFLRRRAMDDLSEDLAQAEVTLLQALDVDAISTTADLAARLDLNYVTWAYSCCREWPLADPRCLTMLAASSAIYETAADAGVPPERLGLLRPGVHQTRSATCFVTPSHVAAIVAAADLDLYAPVAAALQSFADLKAAGRQCVFFLVGNGRAERALRQQAEKLNLMDELTFVDRTGPEQLTDIIKAADLFVWPAPTDRVDIELLSAMAGGVPVLVADRGIADFVIPDQTALAYPTANANALTELLLSLLDNHDYARELAERALAHLRENHSPARMVCNLANLYRAILGVQT